MRFLICPVLARATHFSCALSFVSCVVSVMNITHSDESSHPRILRHASGPGVLPALVHSQYASTDEESRILPAKTKKQMRFSSLIFDCET